MTVPHPFPLLPYAPAEIAGRLLNADRRILLFGETGIGKSTLAAGLARALYASGRTCRCISADPGSPGFGVPGAVSLGEWRGSGWHVITFEALCTLNAGRFRLPLIAAAKKLVPHLNPRIEGGVNTPHSLGAGVADGAPSCPLLIDAPGVVRGIAGAELLTGLVESLEVYAVLALIRGHKAPPLADELCALPAEVYAIHADPKARRPGKKRRDKRRTAQWDAYLEAGEERNFDLSTLQAVGAPPPSDVGIAWSGRQCAFLDGGRTRSLGEVIALADGLLRVRLPRAAPTSRTLLVRDARRGAGRLLGSAEPFAAATLQYLPPSDVMPYPSAEYYGGPRPVARVGGAFAVLVNGVFGDPLLHLRLRQEKRSLLFDLGEPGRLPTRIAHQVSDVFISHAHIDHIGGFLWLLRSRMGDFPACRLYGPPGLARHIEGLIGGILWDRIGDTGPRFDVAEVHGDRLKRFRLRAGRPGSEPLPEVPVQNGLILDDPLFRVRTVTLDHGTPVLAFAYEAKAKLNIDKERLKARGFSSGPWLNRLKERIGKGETHASIPLPDGTTENAGALAEALVTVTPGEKLVYATDLADTPANRTALIGLAEGAHTFFCESPFLEADAGQGRRTGHLTTRACGEIAAAADVQQLVPFHFSRRYENHAEAVYLEIGAVCSRLAPPPPSILEGGSSREINSPS